MLASGTRARGPLTLRHGPEAPAFNPAESPLGWFMRRSDPEGRPLIGSEQLAAGERLMRDFHIAGKTPRVTASWSGIPCQPHEQCGPPGHAVEIAAAVAEAQERVIEALGAVGAPYYDLLIDVLCFNMGIEEVERSRQFPVRSAKRFLLEALTLLAYHYGLLERPDAKADVRRRLRHWGAEDFRPSVRPPE